MGRRYVRHRLYMVRPVQAGSVKPRRPVSTPGRTPISENLPASRKDKEYGMSLPAEAAEAKLTAEIIRKTKKYEPRAQVLEVSYETSRSQQGNIRPKVVINIV